jgi:predicted phage terminase large subunit-like protein
MSKILDPQRAFDAILRSQFLAFVMKVFHLLLQRGEEPFVMSKHIDAMCFAVQELIDGQYNRLIIEVPPRHGKSICVSVALPAFLLGLDPAIKILVASYGAELADEHTASTRFVMSTEEYRRLFPDTVLSRDRQGEFATTLGGTRKAVSVGGATTGFGADIIIIDDLIKADAAKSEAETRRVEEYLSSALITRLNNQETGKIIVIQQRLSELDPAAYLREKGGFKILSLPAIAQEAETIPLSNGRTWTRTPGDLLCPERFPREVLKRLEKDMGKARFSAQYLQNPTPPGGNRLIKSWFKIYDFEPKRQMFQAVIQSWDTGQSAEAASDYSVCTTWGLRDRLWHLIDVYRGKLEYHQLLKKAKALHRIWEPDKIIIEKAGSGHSLVSDLRHPDGGLRAEVRIFQPKLGKEERFEEALAQIEDGRFALPTEAPWLQDFIRECLAFPNGRHDDQVDSLSQFVLWEKSSFGRAAVAKALRPTVRRALSRRERLTDDYLIQQAQDDARNYAARDRLLQG